MNKIVRLLALCFALLLCLCPAFVAAEGETTVLDKGDKEISPAPTIVDQPKSVTVYVGKKATFTVIAVGDGELTYRWEYKKPGDASWTRVKVNGTSATYSLTTAARHNGYKYRCQVENAYGTEYTETVTLTVSEKPVITAQPKAVVVNAGVKATFTVRADGATAYKWQYKKPSSSAWTNVKVNGTSASYVLTAKARHNGYKYRCQVKNAKGSVYTAAVKLTVR